MPALRNSFLKPGSFASIIASMSSTRFGFFASAYAFSFGAYMLTIICFISSIAVFNPPISSINSSRRFLTASTASPFDRSDRSFITTDVAFDNCPVIPSSCPSIIVEKARFLPTLPSSTISSALREPSSSSCTWRSLFCVSKKTFSPVPCSPCREPRLVGRLLPLSVGIAFLGDPDNPCPA